MKSIHFIFFLFISVICFSQESDSLRVSVKHEVINPTPYDPNTYVKTYLEINDSIDLFIDNVQKYFGEIESMNGVFIWQGISIDSVDKNLKIVMYNGIWNNKKSPPVFEPISVDKVKNLKSYEKRGIRMQVFLKSGKDALTNKSSEMVIVAILEQLLNAQPEEESEEKNE